MMRPSVRSEANRFARRHRRGEGDTSGFSSDTRSRTERDAARILYSPYYQRLADVTQIISPGSTAHVVHSRQAHAEKTAQIAEALTTSLVGSLDGAQRAVEVGGLDGAAALAGGRAHDLGHPPFGHVGEEALDAIAGPQGWDIGGFQGNAQSFRVLTKLATQPGVEKGLNLTRASLNAMMKYPWMRDGVDPKRTRYYSVYATESDDHQWAREAVAPDRRDEMTAEALIVDFADDITYALHDVEDFWKVGALSLQEVAADPANAVTTATVKKLQEKHSDKFDWATWNDAFTSVARYLQSDAMKPLRRVWAEQRDQEVAIRELTSNFLTRWMNGMSFSTVDGTTRLVISGASWHEVNFFKQVTWDRVIARPALGAVQMGQRRVIQDLAEVLCDAVITNPTTAPTRLREFHRMAREEGSEGVETDEQAAGRATVDFIASLTERQAANLHGTVTGRDPLASSPGWIQ